jgi:hypothetical protein
MKQLVESHPQQFTSWVLEGAQFKRVLKSEFQQRLYADSLLAVSFKGQDALLHFEFQSSNDASIGERLHLYNAQASHTYDNLPVYSYVIYLRRDGIIKQSPYTQYFPDGREIVQFYYESIELWNTPAEELLSIDFNNLLPLVLLTKGGTEPEVVEKMIDKLVSTNERGLLTISYTLGGLVFKEQQEQDLFKRRFRMLRDILEDSWTFQELKEEAKQAAKRELEQEAQLKAEQKATLASIRATLVDVTQQRFPTLTRLVKTLSSFIDDPNTLLQLITRMSTAQTLEDANELLISLGDKEE